MVLRGDAGFSVICEDGLGRKRLPLRGFCSHTTIQKIQEKTPESDPVGEVVDVIQRCLEIWEGRGLI